MAAGTEFLGRDDVAAVGPEVTRLAVLVSADWLVVPVDRRLRRSRNTIRSHLSGIRFIGHVQEETLGKWTFLE